MREAVGVARPVGTAAVDHDAAHRRAMAAHELGQRMHDDVGAVLDRAQQDRRRDRIVDDQRHAVAWATSAIASMSQMLPAGLPTLSQKTARVFSSISASMSSALSLAAKRPRCPGAAARATSRVWVVP